MNVTAADVIREVRAIAASRPDYVYDERDENSGNCYYVRQNEDGSFRGSCIVGRALLNLGVDPREINVVEPARVAVNSALGLGIDQRQLYIAAGDYVELSWLDAVQGRQDRGVSWGVAVEEADEMFEVEA